MNKSSLLLLQLLVMLMIVDLATPLISCTTNAQCRRNSCITGYCQSRSQGGGQCDAANESGGNDGDDGDCLGDNVCFSAQCKFPSAIGEECDDGDDGDCDDGLVCVSSTCYEPWIPQSTMPIGRSSGVAGTIGDSIFLALGTSAVTSRFQPDAIPSQWPSSPSYDSFPPGIRTLPGYAVVGGKLFVMGGGNANSQVFYFDPTQPSGSTPSDQWKILTPLPAARRGACAVPFGNRIYFFGGRDSTLTETNTIYVFDPSDAGGMGSWTTLGVTLPEAMALCGAAQQGEYIYIAGGTPDNGDTLFNTILRFKPDGSGGGDFDPFPVGSIPVLATGRSALTATTVNGKIIIAGGFNGGALASVEMFDPSTNTVSSLPDLNIARYFHQTSALGSNLFVFGGTGTSGVDTTSESLFIPA